MRMPLKKFTSVCFLVSLVGCATQSTLTISSQPSGAYITEIGSGTAFGTAPVVIRYDAKSLQSHKDANGCFLVRGVKAQWVSGATSSSQQNIKLCGSSTGAYTYQLSRDTDAQGLDKDLDFAMRQGAVRAQQQQAQALQDAAAIQAWSAIQAAQPKPAPLPTPIQPITCNSYAIGSSVQTNCR